MGSQMSVDIEQLPTAGPAFEVGERVVFFPAEIGPTSMWMHWDDAIIKEIREAAQSFMFHFASGPGVRHGQGFENVTRKTADYDAWRAAGESTFARTGDEDEADREMSPSGAGSVPSCRFAASGTRCRPCTASSASSDREKRVSGASARVRRPREDDVGFDSGVRMRQTQDPDEFPQVLGGGPGG